MQVASLQMKIVAEDKLVEGKTQELLSEWEKDKPVEVGVCRVITNTSSASSRRTCTVI